MKTKLLRLHTDRIKTDSLQTSWHDNGQMRWYEELKNGTFHGDSKWWSSDGILYWHDVYENGRLVKRIV